MTITTESGKTFADHEYMDMAREHLGQAIERVLADFDFAKAALVLYAMDWKYVGASASPSADDLRVMARKLLLSVVQEQALWTAEGPLEVRAQHSGHPAVITVELSLKPVRSSDVFIDSRVMLSQEMKRQLREKSTEEKKKEAAGPRALEFK